MTEQKPAANGKSEKEKGGGNETLKGLKIVLDKLKTVHKLGDDHPTVKEVRRLIKENEK